jgi:hypothetical protein
VFAKASRERHTASGNPQENEFVAPVIRLENLVGNAFEDTFDVVGLEHFAFRHVRPPSPPRWTAH